MNGRDFVLDPTRTAVYAPLVLAQVPRLLGQLDRDPYSPSHGSFDRDHWAWKFRDFPILMPQWATCALAWLYRLPLPDSPWFESDAVLEWCGASLSALLDRQHPDGAFDHIGPNTRDYGGTIASLYYLAETLRLTEPALDPGLSDRARDAIDRAAGFAQRTSEDYAFVSNHHALFALGYAAAADCLDRPDLEARSREAVAEILAHQSPDGFFAEYGGFDPGYESLGIDYLARLWTRNGDDALGAALDRSVAFYKYAVHEDGSVGGFYGSRQTRLWAPAGFEILAARSREAAAIAAHLRARLDRHNVVTPGSSDSQNLYVVLLSYLQACMAPGSPREIDELPCHALRGVRHWPSGFSAAGTDSYYAVVAGAKAAACRIDDRATGEILWEDAGYIVEAGGTRWASQQPAEISIEPAPDGLRVRARLTQADPQVLGPVRFVILRLLNLTVFRSLVLGRWVRNAIIGRLITAIRPGPFRLERELSFKEDGVAFSDALAPERAIEVDRVVLARRAQTFHMGSAGYAHTSDLVAVRSVDSTGMAPRLSEGQRAELSFEVVPHAKREP